MAHRKGRIQRGAVTGRARGGVKEVRIGRGYPEPKHKARPLKPKPAVLRVNRINPAAFGFVENAGVYSGRIKVCSTKRPATISPKIISLSFELRGGFVGRRSIVVNGKPIKLADKNLKLFNSALSSAAIRGRVATIRVNQGLAKALLS